MLQTFPHFFKAWCLVVNTNEHEFFLCLLGSGNTNEGADPGDEPQLHRVQIPTDQSTSLDEGLFMSQQEVGLNPSIELLRNFKTKDCMKSIC